MAALALGISAGVPGRAAAQGAPQIDYVGLLVDALNSGLLESALAGESLDGSLLAALSGGPLADRVDPVVLQTALQLIDMRLVRQRDRALDRADRAYSRGDYAQARKQLDIADRVEEKRARAGFSEREALSDPRDYRLR